MLNQILRHKGVWGLEVLPQVFLSLSLERGELSASRIDRLTPRKRAPYPVIRGSVDPTVGGRLWRKVTPLLLLGKLIAVLLSSNP